MKRRTVKIAVDIAMAAVLVAVMTTAIVQEAPHEWLGVTLFVLLVVHIVLNRKWLASVATVLVCRYCRQEVGSGIRMDR